MYGGKNGRISECIVLYVRAIDVMLPYLRPDENKSI